MNTNEETIIWTFVYILFICLGAGLFLWAIREMEVDPQIQKFARVGIVVLACVAIMLVVLRVF